MSPWSSPSSRPLVTSTLTGLALLAGLTAGGAAAAPASAATPSDRSAPRHDTLFPTQGNAGYQVRHYDVALDYDPVLNHLDATTTVRATARRTLASFHLDLEGLGVSAVTVDGEPATFTRRGTELVVTPASPVDGRFRAVVAYAGTPQEHTDTDGSTEGWVRTADGAIALGEPVGAMTWLPSNNTPGDKATYAFHVRAPSTVQVVANGDLVDRVVDGTDTTWEWRATDPMATYLATVAIGKFDVEEDTTTSITGRTIPIWSFTDPTTPVTPETRAGLKDVLRFEEKRFGAYPFTSTGMVVDNARVGYALETQTRPFYPGGVDTGTLVHEMAHQWFGDSLTLVDWHDIWLAEGFATYAEWLWDAKHGGPTPAEHFADLYARPESDGLWHPSPRGFTDSADLFGTPVYARGAMTLQALRERVGSRDFFAIVKAWAKAHRHGSVHTQQLVRLSERISGRELSGLFRRWLDVEGKPAGY
ncbi:M1 family metallopeptidase [Nocardioides luti]|uniref:M1 family metallopeptidase n=1 Tax=Nocardioides luti TaxID=2761101 RepID=UPI001C8A31AE|nr:M1 family metallopeptidase [Nocardioides luti]